MDSINDGLLPPFLLLPPRAVADLTVTSAEMLDRELEEASPGLIADIERLAPTRLNRSIHRKRHLDEMESSLKKRRK